MVKVTIYSTPTCPYCQKTKQYLEEHQVEYEEVNVAGDAEKIKEMQEKSGQMGVPVLDVEGNIIVGFDKPAIDQAVGIGS
ncbi:MAG: NrdH-redoxin [Candidatus Omnitrophica bacterium]|nr:NrdH-redoxin [Candidatus Omnitrophota bacterium]